MTDQEKETGGNVSRLDTFVLGASAAAIAALPAGSAAASTKSRPTRVDVVVVGAGFAGLIAARELRRAGKSVIILEADHRVGGRTKPGVVAGERIDIGGQWVGPTQTELLALTAEYGVASIEQYADGDNIIDINGYMARYKGETPALPDADLEAFGALVAQLDGYANQIVMPKPWLVDQANAWDAHTVESWMQANVTSESVRALMRVLVRAVFSTETGQCSFLYFLSYLASAGGLEALISIHGGALIGFFAGGPAQDWADRPAAERRAKVLADIALYFGDEALAPTDYLEGVWTRTPLNRGGDVAVTGPGVLTAFGEALAEPVGRIHWAGTETSDVWVGYVDGAIRSGKRAAAEVLSML